MGSSSRGGLEMNQVRNAFWMMQRGHDVVFLCLKDSPVETMAKDHQLPIRHISQHKKYYDLSKGRQLAEILKEEKVSHLILRSTSDMSLAVIAKRRLKGKIHLSYFMEMQLGVRKTNFLHTFRFRHFDLWSCPLNWLQDQVINMTRFPKERTVVIPSGMDLSSFPESIDIDTARAQLELPNDKILFGLIGRFDPQKGQLQLIDAMVECKNKDFGVVLLGEPTLNEGDQYFELMKNTISRNELSDRIFIRPFRKDIVTFYKAIDWFVMASKAETFGMVTIEAMACGTPTLGSNAGGTPELLKYGKMGVLFRSLDSEDLAQKMDEIMEGKYTISRNTLTDEAKRFDHNSICKQVEKALGI